MHIASRRLKVLDHSNLSVQTSDTDGDYLREEQDICLVGTLFPCLTRGMT